MDDDIHAPLLHYSRDREGEEPDIWHPPWVGHFDKLASNLYCVLFHQVVSISTAFVKYGTREEHPQKRCCSCCDAVHGGGGERKGREGMALRPLTVMTSREKRPATDADATQ